MLETSPTRQWTKIGRLHLLVILNTFHIYYELSMKFMIVCFETSELTAPELMLRKLVSVSDLTICLDRCNAQGKIPTYQV
jgi:hypothetical protein